MGIVGARGTGKTTLLLRQLADSEATGKDELHLAADHIPNGLYETAAYFFRPGGKHRNPGRLRPAALSRQPLLSASLKVKAGGGPQRFALTGTIRTGNEHLER